MENKSKNITWQPWGLQFQIGSPVGDGLETSVRVPRMQLTRSGSHDRSDDVGGRRAIFLFDFFFQNVDVVQNRVVFVGRVAANKMQNSKLTRGKSNLRWEVKEKLDSVLRIFQFWCLS